MSKFVSTDIVNDWGYLTVGKMYEVLSETEDHFTIKDDDGNDCICNWVECNHIRGGNWKVW